MEVRNKAYLIALSSLMVSAASPQDDFENLIEKERCYCVVKEGYNDCANSTGSHRCATYSEKTGDCGEWLLLPKGLCDRLVNSSLEPKK